MRRKKQTEKGYRLSVIGAKWRKRYKYAEGWIRHNPLGFCDPDDNPLMDVLGPSGDAFVNENFEKTTRLENYI